MIYSRKVAKADKCFKADSDQEVGDRLHQQVYKWQEVGSGVRGDLWPGLM